MANGLDTTGQDMLSAALTGDAHQRPTARAWQVHLSRLIGRPIEPPRVLDVQLDRQFTLTGHPVELTWSTQDAVIIEVLADHRHFTVDGRAGRGTIPVILDRTGYVRVRVVNESGSDQRVVGPIAVLDPPVLREMPVPMPQLTRLSGVWPSPPDYVLPALPSLRTPVFLGDTTDPPPIPAGLWSCPYDVVSMMTGPSALDLEGT
jgi:hypothetical protein